MHISAKPLLLLLLLAAVLLQVIWIAFVGRGGRIIQKRMDVHWGAVPLCSIVRLLSCHRSEKLHLTARRLCNSSVYLMELGQELRQAD